jgi:hypothetical protein
MENSKKDLCKMEFTQDAYGKEILLKDGKFQVMMEWERPYMKACIDKLSPSGDVLEIGFGCGYSATFIQQHHPKSHTIIEYHPVVAEHARKWAENYKNVTIIEGTWQEKLKELGWFDQIFFDDYPLESESEIQSINETSKKASWIVDKGKKFLSKIQNNFSFLKEIKYTDEDLDFFFNNLTKKKSINKDHFLPFFYELKASSQITKEQFEMVVARLKEEGLIDDETQKSFGEKQAKLGLSSKLKDLRGNRFFGFLQQALSSHLKKEGRFSCYIENGVSKYEDQEFFDKVILNPHVGYQEEWIDIKVPDNCVYFKGDRALVILITKK